MIKTQCFYLFFKFLWIRKNTQSTKIKSIRRYSKRKISFLLFPNQFLIYYSRPEMFNTDATCGYCALEIRFVPSCAKYKIRNGFLRLKSKNIYTINYFTFIYESDILDILGKTKYIIKINFTLILALGLAE